MDGRPRIDGKGHRRGIMAAGLCAVVLALQPVVAMAASPTGPAAAAAQPAAAVPADPVIAAASWELLDAKSGQVLAAKDASARIQPASLAKMMTFDLAMQAIAAGRITPDTQVPVGVDAWHIALNPADSRMFLSPNVPVALKDLLTGMMVPSGNDAALAVADFLGGSESGFVQQMNVEAKALGLTDTQFQNSSGLEAQGQYTTAADMAALARHIWLTYPDFKQYTNVQTFTWNKITQQNFNRLIGVDPRVVGLKSGYLGVSGYHLVSTATEGSTDLVAVVMGTQTLNDSATESETLLDWGFGNFHDVSLAWQAALPKSAPVWKGHASTIALRISANPWVTVPGGGAAASSPAPTILVHLYHPLIAPMAAGQVVGSAEAVLGGQTLTHAAVEAAGPVRRGGLPHVLWDSLRLHLAAWWTHLRL